MKRRTHDRPKRHSRRSSILLCWIAGLIPLLGVQSSRAYYHCQITGELLPVCCCEREAPPTTPVPEPPCCSSEDEPLESSGAGLAESECDCCDVRYAQDGIEITVYAESKTVAFELYTHCTIPVGRPTPPRAIKSSVWEPSWSEPPRPPLYILFESFRS